MLKPPIPVPSAPTHGLVLNRPLGDVSDSEAIDLLDVDWTGDVLRSREGAKKFTAAPAAKDYDCLYPHSNDLLLAHRGELVVALKASDAAELAKTGAVRNDHISYAHAGTASGSFTYIADREHTLRRFDGTEFTEPTATVDGVAAKAMPKGLFVGSWPDENRLVTVGTVAAGGPNGALSGGGTVWFSQPGAPEEYLSTSFVVLGTGEEESMVGCCSWGGQFFVFKETKLFVFYGISRDAEEKDIFNFRVIDLGTRLRRPNGTATLSEDDKIVAGPDGVYFVSNDGIWLTTGGEPSLLSEDLGPLAEKTNLVGPAQTTFGELRWMNAMGVKYLNNALYVSLGGESTTRLLKFDLLKFRWTIWTAAFRSMAVWNEETTVHKSRLFFSDAGGHDVYFYTPAKDTDPTVAMSPRWQSGFYGLEDADEKTLVHSKLWGGGEVTVKIADDYGALDGGVAFKLGVAPAIAQRQHQRGQTATLFSHQFSGAAPWSVQRFDRYMRETRVPETQKP